jgi:hypothetical protein
VSLGYAFEQSGSRRQSPPTTPALRAADARMVTIDVRAGTVSARIVLNFDRGRSHVTWDGVLSGASQSDVLGVYLQRADSAGNRVIVQRLFAPGAASGAGNASLRAADRDALAAGRMTVRLLTRAQPGGATAVVRLGQAAGSL